MELTNFDFIIEKAKQRKEPLRAAVAGADTENILQGVFLAEASGIVKPILLGNAERITAMLKDLSLFYRDYTLIDVPDGQDVVMEAIKLVQEKKADCLVRGNTQTRDFLMPILDKSNGILNKGRLLTHVEMMKVPECRKLLAITDVSLLVRPTVEERKKVLKNGVALLNALGYEKPNVALLALVEKPTFHMRDTVDADTIVRDHASRPIADCNIVGPIAYDLIVSKEAARLKGYDCPYCGEFDCIVTPNLLAGNMLVKAMRIHGHATSVGILVGANVPIALTSRSDSREKTCLSLAACAAVPVEDVAKYLDK